MDLLAITTIGYMVNMNILALFQRFKRVFYRLQGLKRGIIAFSLVGFTEDDRIAFCRVQYFLRNTDF